MKCYLASNCSPSRLLDEVSSGFKLFSSQVYLSGGVSSQFLTALLMAAPLSTGKDGIEIIIKVCAREKASFLPCEGERDGGGVH